MATALTAACRCRAPAALLAGLLALAAVCADESAKPAPKAPSASRTLDPAKLPPNAIIIVSDNPRDALQNVDAVILAPEEYKKLLDAAEQVKRLATPNKPEPPSVCRLSGRVETRGTQEVAALRVEYQFRTSAPRSSVLLGLQKAKPVAATNEDGKLAVLVPLKDDDGFAVQVELPGDHRVTVDVEVPLTSRSSGPSVQRVAGERGIELGLPGAAITTIEKLTLPAGATKVRLGGRTVPTRQFTSGTAAAPAFLLGPTPKLELTWEGPAASTKAEPRTSVEGRYEVRVEDRYLYTRARLTLKVQGGAVGKWDIDAPPAAELTAEPTADGTVRVEKPRDKSKPWIVRRDPSTDDLVLDVAVRSDLAPGQPAIVPAFAVGGAEQQRGTITVGSPAHLRLTYRPAADLIRREGGEDAVFAYYRLPETGSPLEMDVQPARGEIETQVNHQLTLAERGWRWQGKFDVRPIRTEASAIDLEVPAELQELRAASAELVEGITPLRDGAPGRTIVRVQLAEARRRAFTFTLDGLYPLTGPASSATLSLPRPVGTLDRGGQLAAAAPAGLDLRGSYREWERDRPGEWDRPLDSAPRGRSGEAGYPAGLAATVERAPARVDLTWRAPRAEVPVTATADIQLGERQATVRHQWHFPAGPVAPRQFVLRGPAALVGRLRVVEGGTLTPASDSQVGAFEWAVQLAAAAGREATLTLAYSFQLPAAEPQAGSDAQAGVARPAVIVPLTWLESCPRCETDVRVWATATPTGILVPAPAAGPWTELPPRAVPDRPTLPDLVLHGSGSHLPLSLRLTEGTAGPGTGLVVDRVWVQAVVDEGGQQAYRTRCLVRPRQTHYLDVELPDPPAAIQFDARLDGKRLNWTASDGAAGRFVRLRLDPGPAAYGAQQLDLIYLLPARVVGSHWQLTLTPPRLRGPVFVGPVRWQIGVSSGDLLLGLGGDVTFEERWSWRRGLLAPLPAWTAADLRHWFAPDAGSVATERGPASRVPPATGYPADEPETALVGWQPAAEPLHFLVVPRPLALMIGSLAILAIGFVAVRVGPRWRVAGALAAVATLAWLAADRPQVLALTAYAIQPGALVLAVVLAARWGAQRRYRRRLLFLPGFSGPAPAGSSLVRNGTAGSGDPRTGHSRSGSVVRREPPTIDAPASQAGFPAG